MRFQNTIVNIVTAFPVCDLGGEKAVVKVWAAINDQEFVHKLGVGRVLQERKKQREKHSSVQLFREMIHRHSVASGSIFLSFTANYTVRRAICRKLLARKRPNLGDSRDGCSVGTPVADWYGARHLTTKLN